ncbi:MAG: MBL fold metallo-hydrolase [Bacillota bacterium]
MKYCKITENVSFLSDRVNIGLIKTKNHTILIDSGLDKSTANKILRVLSKNNLTADIIINTHGHADHYGGNARLIEKTDLKVWAPRGEAHLLEFPEYEPAYFFGGAYPPSELCSKFLKAESSRVDRRISAGEKVEIDDIEIEFVSLAGHSLHQIGVVCQNVLFTADSYVEKDIIKKHGIPYYADIASAEKTLNYIIESNFDYYLPGHGKLLQDPSEVCSLNLDFFRKMEELIIKILASKKEEEDLFAAVIEEMNIKINSMQKYFLLKTTVNAFISKLAGEGKLKSLIKNNKLYWSKSSV